MYWNFVAIDGVIKNQLERFPVVLPLAPQAFVVPWPLFQFLGPIHSLQESLDGGSAHRKASTYTRDSTNTVKTQTFMSAVGLQPTIAVLERASTVHASDRAATLIGLREYWMLINLWR
jgi:hypothetical protein